MSGRQHQFYFLLDLIPAVIVTVILTSAATALLVIFCITDRKTKDQVDRKTKDQVEQNKSECKCKQPCYCEEGCSCCGGSSNLPQSLINELKQDVESLLKYFFSYAWNEKKKADNQNTKDTKTNEENDKSDDSLDLDPKKFDFGNIRVLGIFFYAAAFCLVSSFIALWDSMWIKVQQDNCVEGLDCYIFNGQGRDVLCDRPLNCSEELLLDTLNSSGFKIFCYSIDLDIPRGFSAAGGTLSTAAIQFLTSVAMVMKISMYGKCDCNSYTLGKVLYHVVATISALVYICVTLIPPIKEENLQIYFHSDITKPLQVIVYFFFTILALNIPWYCIRVDDDDKKSNDTSEAVDQLTRPRAREEMEMVNTNVPEEV